jgi:Rhs element Vgr protein
MSLTAETSAKSLVTFQLLVGENKKDLTTQLEVVSISIERACNRIPTAIIKLIDGSAAKQNFELSDSMSLVIGQKIEILVGYQSNNKSLFKGLVVKNTIKSNDLGSVLLVECKEEFFKLTLSKKSKIYYDVTESNMIADMLKEYKLEGDIKSTDHKHTELVQYQCTDWDFIQTRAQINNLLCFVEQNKLICQIPDLTGKPVFEAKYGDNIFSIEAEIDGRSQFKQYEASAWDYSNQEIKVKSADNDGLNPVGKLSSADLSTAMGSNDVQLKHVGNVADEVLQSWVNAKSTYQQLNKLYGTVKIEGNNLVMPGKMLTLAGLGQLYNGNVFISAIHHEINEGTWLTTVQFGIDPSWFAEIFDISQLPASGITPAINGLQIGVVSALEGDPKEEHRILIKLPIISSEEEGVWARPLSFYAGDNFGAHFLPELGTEVLVGFLNDDPNEAIVIGNLYSNSFNSPIEYTDDNFEKIIKTKSEISIHINDDKKSLTLITPGGKEIRLDEDEDILTLLDNFSNEVVMNKDGITITSGKDLTLKASGDIKIEGINVDVKASASLKMEGSSSAELSSSAITNVKGGMVNIN